MALLESKTVLKGVLELTVSVPAEDMQPYLERAAVDLQKEKPVAGFRPGKAPYDAVVKERGAMTIWDASAKYAIADTYTTIVADEHAETIGDPEFQLLKLSPAQPLQYSARVALLPDVRIGDYQAIRVARQEKQISEQEVQQVIDELREMRSAQALVNRASTKEDRITVDLTMSHGGATIEGGQAKDHTIDLFRPYYIQGFSEQVIGLKAGESKKFMLPFPADHYDKNFAGKMVDFDVTMKGVYEFKRPELTDDFARSLGSFSSVDDLKKQVTENLKGMQQTREDQRLEREIIEAIIKQTTFGDIPEILIESELQKIMWRVKSQVEREGGSWNDYLEHLNKKPEDLVKDWLPEAETRVKATLIVRKVAEAENISATPDEVEKERQAILAHYAKEKDKEVRDEIRSPNYDKHLRHIIVTRKVMTKLKDIATAKS